MVEMKTVFKNQICFRATGRYALFTDPVSRVGGEKSTLPIPTYQALKGLTESCYWKPSIIWYIDQVRIMKPIRTESKGVRPLRYDSPANDLAFYCYLADVEYVVKAHFEFNRNRPELQNDWNENKHYFIAKRCIEKGGRRDPFLGTRECQAYIEPAAFTEGTGYYDRMGTIEFGFQYHSMCYPDENGRGQLTAKFWYPKMENGVVTFLRPEECPKERYLYRMQQKGFQKGVNFSGTEEPELLSGYEIGGAVQ